MNLHGIASGIIGAVNPFVTVTLRRSTGYTTSPDGDRVPTYTQISGVQVQVQALSYSDIQQMDSLNIQGVRRAIYVGSEVEGLVRVGKEGGDLLTFPTGALPEGDIWLAAHVLEAWPTWRKVAITLQNGS